MGFGIFFVEHLKIILAVEFEIFVSSTNIFRVIICKLGY